MESHDLCRPSSTGIFLPKKESKPYSKATHTLFGNPKYITSYRTNFCFLAGQTADMSRYREWDISCKVYVGNLGSSASKHEIESAFSKYGPLRNVWVARNPPGFAFVEFEDSRDAEDAVRGLDGT